MALKQPDFTRLFFSTFGGKPSKVQYALRQGACLYHDLAFLASLTHDARFRRKDVRLRAKRLSLPIERDCWELGFTDNGLHIAASHMTVFGVSNMQWSFEEGTYFSPDTELWINSLYIADSPPADHLRFVISGLKWRCHLTVFQEDFVVRLEDQEMPHLSSLRSVKHRVKQKIRRNRTD
jgi:hypothetical protein